MTRDVQKFSTKIIGSLRKHKRKHKYKRNKIEIWLYGNLCNKEIAYGGLLHGISLLEDLRF